MRLKKTGNHFKTKKQLIKVYLQRSAKKLEFLVDGSLTGGRIWRFSPPRRVGNVADQSKFS
jgi:hypothetical protein